MDCKKTCAAPCREEHTMRQIKLPDAAYRLLKAQAALTDSRMCDLAAAAILAHYERSAATIPPSLAPLMRDLAKATIRAKNSRR